MVTNETTLKWPAFQPSSTAQWIDQVADSTKKADLEDLAKSTSTSSYTAQTDSTSHIENATEPRLYVEIPHPWNNLAPSLELKRSLSNRLHTPLSTKAVAAAICTQANSQRRRHRSEGSGMDTPRASQLSVAGQTNDEHDCVSSSSQRPSRSSSSTPRVGTPPPPLRNRSDTVRRFLDRRHRHERSCSAPERPANTLHVNTVLPLNLPPVTQCAAAAANASAPFSLSSNIRRSESLASFVTSTSDGSWHGDDGDQDPDAQLARAINEMQVQEKSSRRHMASKSNNGHHHQTYDNKEQRCIHGHGPLQVSTYDYIDDDDDDDDDESQTYHAAAALPDSIGGAELPPTPVVLKQLEQYQLDMLRAKSEGLSKFANDDDLQAQQDLITQHAGPLIAGLASKLFGIGSSLTEDSRSSGRYRNGSLPSLASSSASSSSTSCISPISDQDFSLVTNDEYSSRFRGLPSVRRPPSPCASPLLSPTWKQPTWWRNQATATAAEQD